MVFWGYLERLLDQKSAWDFLFLRLAGEFRHGWGRGGWFAFGELLQEVVDEVEAAAFLIVEIDHEPGREVGVGCLEHHVAGFAVSRVLLAGFDVDRREFETFGGIFGAFPEAFLLFNLIDAEPVFDQDNAVSGNQAFESRTVNQELRGLIGRTEAHNGFDTSAVVPAAIEQDEFAGAGKVFGVALEIPLAAFAITRFWQRDRAHVAVVERTFDGFDHAALTGRIAAFKDNDDALAGGDDPMLQIDQLALQIFKGFFVFFSFD